MPSLSVVVAVVAAILFAVSNVLQQERARATARAHAALAAGRPTPGGPAAGRSGVGWAAAGRSGVGWAAASRSWLPVLGVIGRLLRDPTWVWGWALGIVGFGLQGLALHLGAVSVVEAIVASQLMFALLMTASRHSLRPAPRDWAAAGCVCAGVALLVLMRGDVPERYPNQRQVGLFLAVVVIVIVVVLVVARRIPHRIQTRSAIVAAAAGISFAATSIVVVIFTDNIARDGLWHAIGWPPVAMFCFSCTGTLLLQDAYAGGSLPTALTAQTVTDPIVSTAVAAVLLDTVPLTGPQLWLGIPAAGILIVVGVALLATSPILHDEHREAAEPVTRLSV